MSGDQRRDRQKSEVRSRISDERRDAIAAGRDQPRAHEGEFEAPTRPRARTLNDTTAPVGMRALDPGTLRTTQDSLHPVPVAPRSTRPPMSLWACARATAALVLVVLGGAVGIVASLHARSLVTERDAADRSSAAPAAPEHRVDPAAAAGKALPAAAPGFAAPPPALPGQNVARAALSAMPAVPSPASAGEGRPVASSASVGALHPSSSAVPFRTLDSLAVSPPQGATPPGAWHRPKPPETPPRSIAVTPHRDESVEGPTPSPASSETPQTKGESDAWVTEERRF